MLGIYFWGWLDFMTKVIDVIDWSRQIGTIASNLGCVMLEIYSK